MQLSEEQIKQAVLHPDLPVRTLAVQYFSRSFSDDTTVMPLVIEAVKNFGREVSIRLIREGETLAQTESTIQWCLDELRQDFGKQDEILDHYRFLLSKVLASADPSLLLTKESEILELPFFLPQFGSSYSERIHLLEEDPEALWNKLTDFCERENEKQYLSEMDLPHAQRLVEALGRGGDTVVERVLTMLNEEIDYSVHSPRELMQGFVLRLAGELRLTAAVPLLVESFKVDNAWLNEECQRALTRIGGNVVVETLSNEFPTAEWHFRLYGSGVLEQLHTERVVQKCLELFEEEQDETIKTCLGRAAISQLASEAIEPVRQYILADKLDPEILDLRDDLVSVCTVLGVEFPEFAEWKINDEESRSLRRKLYVEKHMNFDEIFDDWGDDLDDGEYGFDADTVPDSTLSPTTFIRQDTRIGRNDPCHCGSGKKYKKCCINNSNENPLFN